MYKAIMIRKNWVPYVSNHTETYDECVKRILRHSSKKHEFYICQL